MSLFIAAVASLLLAIIARSPNGVCAKQLVGPVVISSVEPTTPVTLSTRLPLHNYTASATSQTATDNYNILWPNDVNAGRPAGDLIFATVLYRHGDRTPIETYKSDPWGGAEHWPEGWGQLTAIGKRQHFALGTWLRKRYGGTGILKERYNVNDIEVRSTDVDRTLMSATINTAALFAPNASGTGSPNADAWLTDPHWMPVPIHTVPKELDDTLLNDRPCARYTQLYDEMKRTHAVPLLQKHQNLIDYLEANANITVGDDLWQVNNVLDALLIERLHGLPLPAWTQRIYPGSGEFQRLSDQAFVLDTFTAPMARLKYGRLVREILQRMADKSAGRLEPDRSMWVYSGHDTTLSGVLNTLGLFDAVHAPPYASAVLFELRRVDGRPYVQVFYRRGWATTEVENRNEAELLAVPMCGTLCPLDRLLKMYAHVLPTGTFEEECAAVGSTGQLCVRSAAEPSAHARLAGVAIVMVVLVMLSHWM